jgi:hypothetical protein
MKWNQVSLKISQWSLYLEFPLDSNLGHGHGDPGRNGSCRLAKIELENISNCTLAGIAAIGRSEGLRGLRKVIENDETKLILNLKYLWLRGTVRSRDETIIDEKGFRRG